MSKVWMIADLVMAAIYAARFVVIGNAADLIVVTLWLWAAYWAFTDWKGEQG